MAPLLVLAAISGLTPLADSAANGSSPAPHPYLSRQSAGGMATVRILTGASIGAGLGAPAPGMTPRVATLTVVGGQSRTLLVYDFE